MGVALLLLAGGGLIGLLLAVLGAGGSVLLLPLLVSGAGLPTREAVPLSLLVVTLLALGNLGPYLRRRQLSASAAAVLGVPALLGSWLGGRLVKHGLVPEAAQLLLFTAAALLAAWLLTRHRPPAAATADPAPQRTGSADPPGLLRGRRSLLLLPQGLVVGLLTGLAGVGGGFAIVPALVLLAGLPMPLASGTSLLLIPLNSLVALAALDHWPRQAMPLLLPLAAGGFLGAIAGQRLAARLPEQRLRQAFAALLLSSALLSAAEAWRRQASRTSPGGPAATALWPTFRAPAARSSR